MGPSTLVTHGHHAPSTALPRAPSSQDRTFQPLEVCVGVTTVVRDARNGRPSYGIHAVADLQKEELEGCEPAPASRSGLISGLVSMSPSEGRTGINDPGLLRRLGRREPPNRHSSRPAWIRVT